jgi:hypothetical protein
MDSTWAEKHFSIFLPVYSTFCLWSHKNKLKLSTAWLKTYDDSYPLPCK